MKGLTVLLLASALSMNVFAAGDSTPSFKAALKAARDYAFDKAFANILDESSSVNVKLSGDNGEQFLFTAIAKTPGLSDCVIEIKVSKETGMAFQDLVQSCQNL